MPSLCDVNVLLALCHASHIHHASALNWLNTITADSQAAICRMSQLGLLRLLSNPSVMMGEPLDAGAAWHVYDMMMSDERFIFCAEPRTLEDNLRRMIPRRLASPRLWQDTYLAAFAVSAGYSCVSFDRGFRQFKELELLLLGDAGDRAR